MQRYLWRALIPSLLSIAALYIIRNYPWVYRDIVYWALPYTVGLGGALTAVLFIPYAVTVKLTGGALKPAGYEELGIVLVGSAPLLILYVGVLGTTWYSSLTARTGGYLFPLIISPAIISVIVIMAEYLRSPKITALYKAALYITSVYVITSAILYPFILVYTFAVFKLGSPPDKSLTPLVDYIPLIITAISAAISAAVVLTGKSPKGSPEGGWAPFCLINYFTRTVLRRLKLEYRIAVSNELLALTRELIRVHESLREVFVQWKSR